MQENFMSHFIFWRRLDKILLLYKNLLGVSGICKMLVSGLLISLIELGGLALIFPFIKLVTDLKFYEQVVAFTQGTWVASFLENHSNAVLIAGLCIMVAYVLQGIINASLVRYQANIAAQINAMTSDDLVKTALSSRYQLFLEHSPVKIAGISYSNTTHGALLFRSLALGFNEVLIFSLALISFAFISPSAFAYFCLIVFILGVGVFLPISRKVALIGRNTQEVDLERHRFIFAMASAIRDIKIMGLEIPFIRRNREFADKHAHLAAQYSTIATEVRMAIEVVLVCGVVAAGIWYSWRGEYLNEAAPIVITFGLVAIRLAPSLSRLAGAYNGFRYSLPFVEGLLEMQSIVADYQQCRIPQTADFPGEYRANNVHFSYGNHEILHDCTISIGQGEVVAIVGPSGAGKSTLLDILAGLQPASKGTFSLGGLPFSPFHSKSFPARLGYVPQSIALFNDSIAFNISLEESPDTQHLMHAIERASLIEFINSLPQGIRTRLGEGGQGLSGGQRQRLGIARALYRNPALLILDEITSALDEATAYDVMHELLQMRGEVSLLFVTHDIRRVDADRVYQINKGRLMPHESRL
jgi:ABC-type bacteriocin/lantibiotic exporter with double-glycine peptidase domain